MTAGGASSGAAVKVLFCLRRRAGMTAEEFRQYWRHEHGPLGASLAEVLGAERYVQNHPVEGPLNDALRTARGTPLPFDGVAELWFPGVEALEASLADRASRRAARVLRDDEAAFVDAAASPIFVVREHELFRA